ncbi:hypothetical protein GYMLUDRAFT_46397 [Collybiopsis luxurians FD-317 M1]|uniref:Telomere-associated protein Rif1 N-terminal domain-containing protein n=1 Tax=Collybiopsis luxurians FD-317 M1 TaxID=944289 RepID=A0A0D0CPC9_9AGAR|nr:hypothetical protein GYMLUDRAFT_46397 [Collybiopsis luxurians FD-317 M1]
MKSSSPTSSQGSAHPPISSNILLSPLETLHESLSEPGDEIITLHDLIEAYSVLAMRIKGIVLTGFDLKQTTSALSLLKERSQVLFNALRRDIMRVTIPPCLSPQDGMNVDEIQYAHNLAQLGQQAIGLTSELFAFPPLYFTFSVEQLRFLLNDVLVILSKTTLPTPHSKRTFMLLRYILQTQRLPPNVLSPHKSKIFASVRRCLKGEKERVFIDGLKILAELLREYPRLFIGPACDLFDKVLRSFTAESSEIRFVAAHSLSAYAYAKVSMNLGYQQKVPSELSSTVCKFSAAYLEDPFQEAPLYRMLQSACEAKHISDKPQWAAVVMASLIVLIDRPIFKSDLRFRLRNLLRIISDHTSPIVNSFIAPVWACFVWAFARIPADDPESKEAQAWLSQDFRNGIGSLVCYVHFSVASKNSVERVLDVVREMLDSEPSKSDAVSILCQLLGPSIASGDDFDILYKQLFDGSILETHLAESTDFTTSRYATVRALGIQEVALHWDRLYHFWSVGIKLILNDELESEIPSPSLTAWQTLLHAHSGVSETQGHLAPSSRVAAILEDLCKEYAPKAFNEEQEVKQIHLLRALWASAQRTFTEMSLEEPRDHLLSAIVRRDFQISDGAVQLAWLQLCRTITTYPDRDMDGRPTADNLLDFDNRTWVTIARKWVTGDSAVGDSLVTFLKFMFPERLTSDEELELWGSLFSQALAAAKGQANSNEAVKKLWKTFVPDDEKLALAFPRQYHALLSAFLNPYENNMSKEVLPLYDKLLCELYLSFEKYPLSLFLRYITTIHDMLLYLPVALVSQCLASLCAGLCHWFKDKSQIVPDDVYSHNLLSLYQHSLERLRLEQPNETILISLWQFFLSPFQCHDAPASAWDSFETFWNATYLNREEFFHVYDPELKRFLKAMEMSTGGGIAAGLTESDDSQMTGSIVPETQQEPLFLTASQALAHWVDIAAEEGRDINEIIPSSSSPPPALEPEPLDATPRQNSHSVTAMHVDEQDRPATSKPASSSGIKRKRRVEEEEIVEASFVRASSSSHSPERDVGPEESQPVRMSPRDSTQHRTPKDKPISKNKGKAKALPEVPPTQTPRIPNSRSRSRSRERGVTRIAPSRSYRESHLMTPEPSAPPSSHYGHFGVSVSPQPRQEDRNEEDYGDWEKPISPGSLAQISGELDVEVPIASDDDAVDDGAVNKDPSRDLDDNAVCESPSVRPSKKRKPSLETHGSPPLRRSNRNRTTSDKLLRLQQALQALKDDPDTPMEDLVKASDLMKEFGSTVDKKLVTRNQNKKTRKK